MLRLSTTGNQPTTTTVHNHQRSTVLSVLSDYLLLNSNAASRGAGSLRNDKVPSCKFCRQNGFPHEAIIFKPAEGHILADGRALTMNWLIYDYFEPWHYISTDKWRLGNLYLEYDDIHDPLRFTIDTILKEAKEESRLVKQILYSMLSAYTNYPINLAINSPSDEGKTYVLQKVGELFPKQDAMFLAGMTEKALFHRAGEDQPRTDSKQAPEPEDYYDR